MTRGRQSNARNKLAKVPAPDLAVLGEAEAAVWTQVCRAQSAEWLETGPGPQLETYCYVVVQMREAQAALRLAKVAPDTTPKQRAADITSLLSMIERLEPLLGRLSRALRLTPQSRMRADKTKGQPAQPWDQGDDEDSD